ncbi:bifunctional DNA primase/polymerase [Streptomyces cucumeris]|uniref:bifunctional DNA primase/polymerase n=1 Tax=Streptomyces cucumeris TaxID=2962890 RepID=UPI003EB77E94
MGDMATTALAHALAAAEHGFRVIPLTRAKLPAVRSPHHRDPRSPPCRGTCGLLGHGIHDASADPGTVRALFAAAPWATAYGIACGCAPHHLIGVDLDVRPHSPNTSQGANGGPHDTPHVPHDSPHVPHGLSGRSRTDGPAALARLAREHGFTVPRTVTVLTPGGGRHLWLSGPPGLTVPNSAGRLAPGVDIRGAGGYLVGPGSTAARGGYRLAPGSPVWTPAPVPPALLRLLRPPAPARRPLAPGGSRPPEPRPAALTALVRFVRESREGQRNTRLFWAACRAYETGAGAQLAPDLVQAAVDTGLTCREAQATVASAARSAAHRLQPPAVGPPPPGPA